MALNSVFQEPVVAVASGRQPQRLPDAQPNPLRKTAAVRMANYQQDLPGSSDPFSAPTPLPPLPGSNALQEVLPDLSDNASQPNIPILPSIDDPLATPQDAPAPNTDAIPNPFPRAGVQDASPLDRDAEPLGQMPAQPRRAEELDAPKRREFNDRDLACDNRNRSREIPIADISLDISPAFGEGLSGFDREGDTARAKFSEDTEIRSWSDAGGRPLASGRMLDLRDDSVILDVNGSKRSIPLNELSDSDIAYVGKSWNIPLACGTGYEPFEGRNFIASTVQWTASGLCHKPLYFEQVQLERYGHETGPLLQPLISTAHFFGNMVIEPYLMGIHPPNECQYALGYYRPGDCAPYMVQPFPWSLRGAAVQAGVVTGAAALIP